MVSRHFSLVLVLTLLLPIFIPAQVSSVHSSAVSTHLTGNNALTYDYIIGPNTVSSQSYFNSSILIIGTIFVTNLLNFTQCDVSFLRNNTFYSSGIRLNNNSTLILTNSIFHINSYSIVLNNDRFPLIQGFFNTTISVRNSIFYSNSTFNNVYFYLDKGQSLYLEKSFFYNSTKLVLSSITTNVNIHNCHFFSPASDVLTIDKSNNFYFSNNYISEDKNPLENLFNITATQNTYISSNIFIFNSDSVIEFPTQDYIFICSNIPVLNIFNNTFRSFQMLFLLTGSSSINVTQNNFSYFSIAFSLLNFSNSFFKQNNFMNGSTILYLDRMNFKFQLNCTFNNFYSIDSIINIGLQNQENVTHFLYFSYNHYSDFNPIKSENSGISKFPYKSEYFTDYHPLIYSFENYEILDNEIVLKSNGYYNQSLSEQNFSLIGNQLLIIILFYGSLLIIPLFVLLIYKRPPKKID